MEQDGPCPIVPTYYLLNFKLRTSPFLLYIFKQIIFLKNVMNPRQNSNEYSFL